MNAQQSNRRAFERRLFTPAAPRGKEKPQLNRGSYYQRLMHVSIWNSYYNNWDSRCPDFTVHPTVATSALISSLGLMFKDDGFGFSVLYDTAREENLISFLRMQANDGEPELEPERKEVWTRLSFVLCLKNMFFTNFTRIPINTNPTSRNFFFSNQNAREKAGGKVILNSGNKVNGSEMVPVTAVQHSVPVSRKVEYVQVCAISGLEVICKPRCVPVDVARVKNWGTIDCTDIEPWSPPLDVECTDVIYLDFSLLPEDKYTITKVGYDGQPAAKPKEILYTASYPIPLCFIDLLFTDPILKGTSDSPQPVRGIYPVRNLWLDSDTPRVFPVDYHLEFRRRKTIWSYYVVPQPDSERFEQLKIVDITPREAEEPARRKIRFAGPCCVRLANGLVAYRFISTEAIPLTQQSRFRFQLRGYRRGMIPNEGVLVDRLPVASNEQVLPKSAAGACEELRNSLCGDSEEDPACAVLIDQMCSEEALSNPSEQNYSEIYVYV